jgi:hypothetical protein
MALASLANDFQFFSSGKNNAMSINSIGRELLNNEEGLEAKTTFEASRIWSPLASPLSAVTI